MVISNQGRTTFEESGLLHLKNAIPTKLVNTAKDAIFGELERLQIRSGGKWQLKKYADTPSFQLTSKLSQAVHHHDSFSQLMTPDLMSVIRDLAGVRVTTEKVHPSVLITPPQKDAWRIPHLGWHVDIANPADGTLSGIQAFVLVDHVAPQGGGTVAMAGSHRLHEIKGGHGKAALQVLREDVHFARVFSPTHQEWARFLQPNLIEHLALWVVEMCGKAGDVYLMDMRVLHAPAPNASKNARLMVTSRFLAPTGALARR